MNENNNEVIIYEDKNGVTKVNVKFIDEDIWLTQKQIADIYQTTQENISIHITNIYKDKELDNNSTNKKFLLVQKEGTRKREMKQLQSDFDLLMEEMESYTTK